MFWSDGCLGRENRFYSIGVFCNDEGEEEGEKEDKKESVIISGQLGGSSCCSGQLCLLLLCYKTGSLAQTTIQPLLVGSRAKEMLALWFEK